jgi:hypothetical protein
MHLLEAGAAIASPPMRASLERLLGRPVDFPIEVTLSSDDKYLLPHPEHAHIHPNTRDLVIYPDDGPFSLVINPDQIVSIRSARKAS